MPGDFFDLLYTYFIVLLQDVDADKFDIGRDGSITLSFRKTNVPTFRFPKLEQNHKFLIRDSYKDPLFSLKRVPVKIFRE